MSVNQAAKVLLRQSRNPSQSRNGKCEQMGMGYLRGNKLVHLLAWELNPELDEGNVNANGLDTLYGGESCEANEYLYHRLRVLWDHVPSLHDCLFLDPFPFPSHTDGG